MKSDFYKKKRDYLLELALEERLEKDPDMIKYGDDVEEKYPYTFSLEHEKRMKKIFKMADRVERKFWYKRKRYQIAAGIAFFFCFSTVAVTQVEAFRIPMGRFFMEIKEKSTLVGIYKENRLNLPEKYARFEPTYVPRGFVVVEVEKSSKNFWVKYEETEGDSWYRIYYWDKFEEVSLDSEEGIVSETEINGYPAVIVQKGNEVKININIGTSRIYLNGTVLMDEAIKIVESIKI